MEQTNQVIQDGLIEGRRISIASESALETLAHHLQDKNWKEVFFKTSYSNACNPGLDIRDVGTVGLPMGTRDAEAIQEYAELLAEKEGRNGRIKVGENSWELDGDTVTFNNADYSLFLENIVKDACETLGVNGPPVNYQCKLTKLCLYGTGSRMPFAEFQETENVFAALTLVLPSSFTGGAIRTTYNGLVATHECSEEASRFKTSAIAWYRDVAYSVEPITSGYMLALRYVLVHPITCSRPTPFFTANLTKALSDALQTRSAESFKHKTFFLLRHQYAADGLAVSSLKGADALRAKALDLSARNVNCHVGLASIVCKVTGSRSDREPPVRKRINKGLPSASCQCGDPEYRDENICGDPFRVPKGFRYVRYTTLSLEKLVNLNGQLLANEVEVSNRDDSIPSRDDIIHLLQMGNHEREGINGGGMLVRWYRRTVLVSWPHRCDYAVRFGTDLVGACSALVQIITESKTASEDGKILVQLILNHTNRATDTAALAAQTVCNAALTWDDVDLWLQGLAQYSRAVAMATLKDIASVFDAIAQFGFSEVSSGLEAALKTDQKNWSRFKFLDDVESWTQVDSRSRRHESTVDIMRWVKALREELAQSLCTPCEEDQTLLLELASKSGDVRYIRTL
ncbi:hypothetical protein EIP91_002224 [Steccherinum ochraceum]|uniref:Uncharacterized protein n=1 Tax=Steccherinum ochraceum TaxID=92696 RepID=A0A4R0RIW2_9APHY|nr:hypothetical protein EIP91_002224 [Steccherinum ochraceum]